MGLLDINIGSVHGDHTGDPNRDDWFTAWTKAKAMFVELYGGAAVAATRLSDVITAASTDDYNPGGGFLVGVGRLDINASTVDSTITGMVAGSDGQQIMIRNIGSKNVILTLEGASSAVANRFYSEGDFALLPGGSCRATYYALPNPRWTIG